MLIKAMEHSNLRIYLDCKCASGTWPLVTIYI